MTEFLNSSASSFVSDSRTACVHSFVCPPFIRSFHPSLCPLDTFPHRQPETLQSHARLYNAFAGDIAIPRRQFVRRPLQFPSPPVARGRYQSGKVKVREKFRRPDATPTGSPPLRTWWSLLFVVSACLFGFARQTVRSPLQLREIPRRRKKKSRCHVPVAILLFERIGRLRATGARACASRF